VAEVGVALFDELDEPDEVALALDRECLLIAVTGRQSAQIGLVGRPPPLRDAGLGLNLEHGFDVL
jgi:hypothetical protein